MTRSSQAADAYLTANGNLYLIGVLIAGSVWFLVHVYEPRSVTFQVPTTSSWITIKFGDIFDEASDWLIGVNEFFDSQLGQVIAKTSVHGQFITNVFGGDEGQFRSAVTVALTGVPCSATLRPMQPSEAYPIGTTAVVPNGAHRAFLVAMSQTDLQNYKASSTVPMLWEAMKGALQAVQNHGNGQPLAMPLIGNGRSSVNIEPQHLLRLITLALVDFGRKVGLPNQVTIVVHDACFKQLDIREIKRDWMRR